MVKKANDRIGLREYLSILILVIGIKSTDTTPSILYKEGLMAAWMIPLVSGAFVFIVVLVMLKLFRRHEGMGLMQIIFHLTGKYFGFIIGILLFFSVTLLTSVNARGFVDTMSDLFFPQTPKVVLFLLFFICSTYIAALGLEAIGRTAWLVIPVIAATTILYIILLYNQLNFQYIFPLWGPGIKKILIQGITKSAMLSELVFFSVIFHLVRKYKDVKRATITGSIFLPILMSGYCAIFLMALDFPPAIINNYPFQTVSRLIYAGRFISNMEAFFLIFWAISFVVRFAMYIYIASAYLGYSLKIERFGPLNLPIGALIMLLGMMPENYMKNINIIRVNLLDYDWIILYPLPFVLLGISYLRKNEKSKISPKESNSEGS